jgi:hypothetical protein
MEVVYEKSSDFFVGVGADFGASGVRLGKWRRWELFLVWFLGIGCTGSIPAKADNGSAGADWDSDGVL